MNLEGHRKFCLNWPSDMPSGFKFAPLPRRQSIGSSLWLVWYVLIIHSKDNKTYNLALETPKKIVQEFWVMKIVSLLLMLMLAEFKYVIAWSEKKDICFSRVIVIKNRNRKNNYWPTLYIQTYVVETRPSFLKLKTYFTYLIWGKSYEFDLRLLIKADVLARKSYALKSACL